MKRFDVVIVGAGVVGSAAAYYLKKHGFTGSIALIERFIALGKPVGAVCHAPGVLRHVKAADGTPLVRGKRVTGFSNSEEEAVALTDVVPFLVEDMLKAHGGVYGRAADWHSHVEVDGLLVTGQNPASSDASAEALLTLVERS